MGSRSRYNLDLVPILTSEERALGMAQSSTRAMDVDFIVVVEVESYV